MTIRRHIESGEVAKAGGLILPAGVAQSEPRIGVCSTCDREFFGNSHREFEKHVYQCAMENLPAILEARAEQKKRMAAFQPESWNPDVDEHLRKVGERMLAEGRLVMRKSERVRNE